MVEKKLKQLPPGPLYWRVENLPTFALAQVAAGWKPDLVRYDETPVLAAEVAGKFWLFTLGAKGGSTPGATNVGRDRTCTSDHEPRIFSKSTMATDLPVPRHPCTPTPGRKPSTLSRGDWASGHPHGVSHVDAGQTMNGHPAGMAMEVFNSGSSELTALIMFVVDAVSRSRTSASCPDGERAAG